MEPKSTLAYSQEPSAGPYPSWHESSAHPSTIFLLRSVFNIVLFLYLRSETQIILILKVTK